MMDTQQMTSATVLARALTARSAAYKNRYLNVPHAAQGRRGISGKSSKVHDDVYFE
jgi:hypothetical protein